MQELSRYWVYHKKECVLGKIVDEKEYKLLLKKGWVKNPNNFVAIIDNKTGKIINKTDDENVSDDDVDENVPRATITNELDNLLDELAKKEG